MKMKSELDFDKIIQKVKELGFSIDGSGVEMSNYQSSGIPYLSWVADEIGKLRNLTPLHIMVNRVKSGIRAPVHKDWLVPSPLQGKYPTLERWHLPLITNQYAKWWDEVNGEFHMEMGYWHGPMMYWKKHAIWNDGPTERIHLIVDLDCAERLGDYNEVD